MIKNAKQKPAVLYGMHFVPGIAEDPTEENSLLFLNEQTLRDMDETFAGCPVYVNHVEGANLARIEEEADGYVVRSFYNATDGKHWAQFLVTSDAGHAAIKQGWKLSNAYSAESLGPAGVWNGVSYKKQIVKGKFDHLALVQNPRYAESVVMTPEQFEMYNLDLRKSLSLVANNGTIVKKEAQMPNLLSLFKKTPVDSTDFEDSIVTLPTGKEVSVKDLVANAMKNAKEKAAPKEDSKETPKEDRAKEPPRESPEEKAKQGEKPEDIGSAPQMANMEHHVMLGNDSMPLKDLMDKHQKMMDCMNTMAEHYGAMQKNDSQLDGGESDAEQAKKADLTKRNADEDGGEKEAKEQLKESDKTVRNDKNFKKLQDAPELMFQPTQNVDQLDQMARGQKRYGSN